MFGLPNPFLYIGLGLVVACGVFFGLWRWDAHELRVASKELDDAVVDAKRWHDASDLRDGSIVTLRDTLNSQSQLVEQGRAREGALRTALDQARSQNSTLQAEADQLSRNLAAEAEKAPADVRPVGPIVARRAPALFE